MLVLRYYCAMITQSRSHSVVALFLAMILFSTAGLLIKLSQWDALALNGARNLIAAVVILIYLRRPRFTWSRTQIGGAIFYAFTTIAFVQANRWTTAANAIFIQFTAPLWVALFGIWLLGERPRRIDWLTMVVVGLGMILIFGNELSGEGFRGNILALMSGMSLALMLISLRKQKGGSPAETVLLGSLISFAIGLPFILFGAQPTNAQELGIIVFLGIFQLGIPFIVVTQVVQQLSAIETILIQTIEPVLNPIWVFLFVGERPSLSAIIGALIVMTAVTVRGIVAAKNGE